jgi:ligand-binding SRPBCC domain-containing protein
MSFFVAKGKYTMITFEKTIFINRPQQEVFDFMSNLENDAQWRSLESVKRTSGGPIGAGSTWRETSKFMGREIEFEVEFISYDPPHQFVAKTTSGPFPMEITNKFETQDGGTLITLSANAEVGGFFKMAEGLVSKQAQKQLESDWAALKKLLEAEYR